MLLAEMLVEAGFPPTAASLCKKFMIHGVPPLGKFPCSRVFVPKKTLPTKSIEDLFRAAKWARPKVLGSMRSSGNEECDRAVFEKTLQEVKDHQARGPFPLSELLRDHGPCVLPVRTPVIWAIRIMHILQFL